MRLVLLPKKDGGFSQGSVFPIMEIPTEGEGEKTSLYDFQWWAPTDKWKEWLKKNPRTWKAESEDFSSEDFSSLFESHVDSSPVIGFDEFYSLLEEEGEGEEGGISKEEAVKKYNKFIFAYNKLTKENKIILNLELEKLQKNQKYAFILDLAGEKGEDVPETRNAYCIKILQTPESSKFLLAEISESILTGEVEGSLENTFSETAKAVGQAILGGAIVVGSVALGVKAATSIGGRIGLTKVLSKFLPSMASTPSTANKLGAFGRALAGAKYYTTSLGGVIPFVKGASYAIKQGGGIATAAKYGSMAVGDARLAAGLARSTNPVGWVITGLMAAQQTYNWLSTNQAPRLGEIEDAGIDAHDSFSPGSIPIGQSITVCWTQEAGQGGILSAIGSALVSQDTRTTMDIVKLGNYNGKALFYLVDIHSESYNKILKENPMILISFDAGVKFERDFFDNDDLELEFIPVKSDETFGTTTYFQGYCGWDEFKQAYDSASDKVLDVSENAPEEYSFYFGYGESGKLINVTGKLIKNLDSVETVKSSFLPEEEKPEKSSNESYYFDHSSEVLSFLEFSSRSESIRLVEQEEEDIDPSQLLYTETQKIAPYSVEKIEYADKNFEGEDLPELLTFIIPNEYLEAEDNQKIEVDPIQDVTLKYPKKGTITIESQKSPEPIPVGATGGKTDGGVPIEVTKGEVKIKFQDNPSILNSLGIPDVTKIKDKDKDDKIKFLDVITPDEKEKLGIEDWDYIKKVKIYKDGKTGDPIMIKFKSGGREEDRGKKIKSSDENFDTALRVAERIQAGFKESSGDEVKEKGKSKKKD